MHELLARSAELQFMMARRQRFDSNVRSDSLPLNGIYFYFEKGESTEIEGESVDRIVRIGCHRVNDRFQKRVRQHITGHVESSIFRKHISHALLEHRNVGIDDQLVDELSPAMIESMVTERIVSEFSFSAIRVDDAIRRLQLESEIIALLAQFPSGPPSKNWLGQYSPRPEIRSTGLWNRQHVNGTPLGAEEALELSKLALVTW